MNYVVKGSDGAKYGPCDEATLRRWISEGRVFPKSIIICEDGSEGPAGDLFPGLFAVAAAAEDSLNWPGLFLAPFWGISHRLWQGYAVLGCWILAAYCFIRILMVGMTDFSAFHGSFWPIACCLFILTSYWLGIFLLYKGKRLAREHRNFVDENHFREVQRKWERALAIVIVVYTALVSINLIQALVCLISV